MLFVNKNFHLCRFSSFCYLYLTYFVSKLINSKFILRGISDYENEKREAYLLHFNYI